MKWRQTETQNSFKSVRNLVKLLLCLALNPMRSPVGGVCGAGGRDGVKTSSGWPQLRNQKPIPFFFFCIRSTSVTRVKKRQPLDCIIEAAILTLPAKSPAHDK